MRTWCLLLLALALPARAGTVQTDVPERPDPARIHLIYLHGRIVEDAGPRPTDPHYGPYDYPAVLEALASRGAAVISAQRPPKTDVNRYAGIVVSQVETLIERGVPPEHIVVAGFSKGGAIAKRVSSFLRRPEVRFVLLATCPAGPLPPQTRLTGRVFSVYESSDELGGTCEPLAEQSGLESFEEIRISTGKEHGAFYMPLREWVAPVLDWVHGTAR